jgi:hypothetical protein
VEAVPPAESLFEKEDGVERVGQKISVDPVHKDVELVPRELSLLLEGIAIFDHLRGKSK